MWLALIAHNPTAHLGTYHVGPVHPQSPPPECLGWEIVNSSHWSLHDIGSFQGVYRWTVEMNPCGVSFLGILDHTPPCTTSLRGCLQASNPPAHRIIKIINCKWLWQINMLQVTFFFIFFSNLFLSYWPESLWCYCDSAAVNNRMSWGQVFGIC